MQRAEAPRQHRGNASAARCHAARLGAAAAPVRRWAAHPSRAVPGDACSALPRLRASGRSGTVAARASCFAAATASASPAISALAQHAPALAPLMGSAGLLLLSIAGAAFLIACIPALIGMARAAFQAAALMRVLERELPDTMATLRLSGLELSDCIAEMGSLQSELTSGVKASARLVSGAEQGLKTGAALVDHAVKVQLKGAVASSEAAARERLEASLQQRAQLEYTRAVVGQVAGAVRRLRIGVAAANLAGTAVRAGQGLRGALQRSALVNSTGFYDYEPDSDSSGSSRASVASRGSSSASSSSSSSSGGKGSAGKPPPPPPQQRSSSSKPAAGAPKPAPKPQGSPPQK